MALSEQICSGAYRVCHFPLVRGSLSVQSSEKTFEEILQLFILEFILEPVVIVRGSNCFFVIQILVKGHHEYKSQNAVYNIVDPLPHSSLGDGKDYSLGGHSS